MNERSAEVRQLQHTTTTSANIDKTHLKARTHKQDRVLYDTYTGKLYEANGRESFAGARIHGQCQTAKLSC